MAHICVEIRRNVSNRTGRCKEYIIRDVESLERYWGSNCRLLTDTLDRNLPISFRQRATTLSIPPEAACPSRPAMNGRRSRLHRGLLPPWLRGTRRRSGRAHSESEWAPDPSPSRVRHGRGAQVTGLRSDSADDGRTHAHAHQHARAHTLTMMRCMPSRVDDPAPTPVGEPEPTPNRPGGTGPVLPARDRSGASVPSRSAADAPMHRTRIDSDGPRGLLVIPRPPPGRRPIGQPTRMPKPAPFGSQGAAAR